MEFREVKRGDILFNKVLSKYFLVLWKDEYRICGRLSVKDPTKSKIDIKDGIEIGVMAFHVVKKKDESVRSDKPKFIKNCELVDRLSDEELDLFNLIETYMMPEDGITVPLGFTSEKMITDWKTIVKVHKEVVELRKKIDNYESSFIRDYYPELFYIMDIPIDERKETRNLFKDIMNTKLPNE